MAQVASTEPAIVETVIGDNEEDESKVCCPTTLPRRNRMLSHHNTSYRKFSS